jgi:hypothetical protein
VDNLSKVDLSVSSRNRDMAQGRYESYIPFRLEVAARASIGKSKR